MSIRTESDSGASRIISEGCCVSEAQFSLNSTARANTARAFLGKLPFPPEHPQPLHSGS